MKKSNLASNSLFKIAKLCLVFSLTLTCLFLAITPPIISANAQTETTQTENATQTDNGNEISTENQNDQEVVFSYIDVFEVYYETAKENLSQRGIETNFTFEEFCEGYYAQSLDIATYVDTVIEEITVNPTATFSEVSQNISTLSDIGSSANAYYILSSTDYDATPYSAFNQIPRYGTIDFSVLQTGDIIFEGKTSFDEGHTAIICNLNKNGYLVKNSSETNKYIQTIESVATGVTFGFLDDNRMIDFCVTILRVTNVTLTQRKSAISFCKRQLGKPYSYDYTSKSASEDTEKWFCSQLIYAAYYNTNISIIQYTNSSGVITEAQYCLPADIYNSISLTQLTMDFNFLELSVVSKAFLGAWTIKVKNNSNASVCVYYNKKMCSRSDAKEWSGLAHVSSFSLAAHSSTNVQIGENFFADAIAFSYFDQNQRYISYAWQLDNTQKRLVPLNNIV